jgi:hypothetical protein
MRRRRLATIAIYQHTAPLTEKEVAAGNVAAHER